MIFLDWEFNDINSEFVNLVCCTTLDSDTDEVLDWWLHQNPEEKIKLKEYLTSKKEEIFVAYAAVAEGRSMLSLGLDPFDFKWIDLFFEYRVLTNHNDHLLYGNQLINGKVKHTRRPPPKWERTEEDKITSFKPTHSLAEATYKLTGVQRDTDHKDKMRDIIISAVAEDIEANRKDIQDYCTEDVVHLPLLFQKMQEEYYLLGVEVDQELEDEMLLRGTYAALTAKMESWGYPIDMEKTKNFTNAVTPILEECQREINELFPDIKPFRWNKKDRKFSWDQKATKNWLRDNIDIGYWLKTDGEDLSLSLDAWERVFDYRHSYPKNVFGAQMVRYLKLKQQISGFIPSNKGSFWDAVGADGRVRCYTNPFGAQSSRSQQSSRSFLFLKTAWMRAMCMPVPGQAIAGIDYGSEEFLISAILSKMAVARTKKTTKQIEAYASGDVYLAFGKAAGMIPPDGTKTTHKFERDLCKATVLGLSYLMSKYGLAAKLTADTGKEVSVEEAQEYINLFYEVYEELQEWQKLIQEQYQDDGFLKLPCVAKGTKIFTSNGIKSVEDVLIGDLIWDGKNWVGHEGIVLKGEKDVILSKKMGLSATPDHWVLTNGVWKTLVEVEADEGSSPQSWGRYLGDGRLLAESPRTWGAEGLSFVAAYVGLKKKLESMPCNLEELEPVLTALNLSVPKDLAPREVASYLMTNIFIESGGLATTMQSTDARFPVTISSTGMVLEGYASASNPLESSWNTFLHWMGIPSGVGLSTELITMGTMKLETYELLAREKTTKIEVYDILNCGPYHRFQSGGAISHNCGFYVWGPNDSIGNTGNDNFRSVTNVPVQGFGASILRKAVELCVIKGLKPIITLHDAIYIEYDSDDYAALDTFHDCMREAFLFYFEDKESAGLIKLDAFAWSPDYEADSSITTPEGRDIPVSNIYVDERSIEEYNSFSKYFDGREEDSL